jgi:hypothetical protein
VCHDVNVTSHRTWAPFRHAQYDVLTATTHIKNFGWTKNIVAYKWGMFSVETLLVAHPATTSQLGNDKRG